MTAIKQKIHEIIFEADTPTGKLFDVALLWAIIISVIAVMLETVEVYATHYADFFHTVEWILTAIFTIEYVLRIYSVTRPTKYIFSFYGIIDLLAILPSYLSLLVPGTQSLLVIRSIRLLRVFRVLKLARFLRESEVLLRALKSSSPKIIVFLGGVFIIVLIMGALMYLIEGAENGFTSIPRSTYWAIVTVTTVGYGDIIPGTVLGQILSSALMVLGYGIIAVPTGIVSAELTRANKSPITTIVCRHCSNEGHDPDAKFCKHCGWEFQVQEMQ